MRSAQVAVGLFAQLERVLPEAAAAAAARNSGSGSARACEPGRGPAAWPAVLFAYGSFVSIIANLARLTTLIACTTTRPQHASHL